MRNFQDTFETLKGSLINGFAICMTVPFKSFEMTLISKHRIEKLKIKETETQKSKN